MADYMKKVIYLSYMKSGNKIKSAGFIKLEKSSGFYKLDMHISGLTHIPDMQYNIKAVLTSAEERLIGKVRLHKGSGDWCGEVNGKDIVHNDIYKFYIEISGYEAIEGILGRAPEPAQEKKPVKSFLKKPELKAAGNLTEKHKEEIKKEVKIVEKEPEIHKENMDEIRLDKVILSDKWEQLRQLYPLVHPYEDDREYISIKPKDFVIMTGDYQHLANNSFLLHGFYNYRHIILGKEQDTNDFFLGVPGVYYEREKMVALMFGFEAFDCSGGKAEQGKFGYYLKKVTI